MVELINIISNCVWPKRGTCIKIRMVIIIKLELNQHRRYLKMIKYFIYVTLKN